MGLEIPAGYGQATLVFQCDGVSNPMNVTFGFFHGGMSGTPTPDQMASAIRDACVAPTSFLPAAEFSAEYVFMGVDVNIMTGDGEAVGTSRVSLRGTVVGASPMPPNCAILVKKNTALGGRRNKGRMYLPPIFWGEGEVTAAGYSSISSVFNDLQTRLNTFLGLLNTASLTMNLLHAEARPPSDFGGGEFVPPPVPPPTIVTSLTVQPQIATQRRRLR